MQTKIFLKYVVLSYTKVYNLYKYKYTCNRNIKNKSLVTEQRRKSLNNKRTIRELLRSSVTRDLFLIF